MVIKKLSPDVHLQQSYYTIIEWLKQRNIYYETENHIIQRYDPTKLDENGDPLPKPEKNTEGTGYAWIKCFFADRKQYLIYFCCHLVDCMSCEYDRFITIYNYTDDIIDTSLQGQLPISAITKLPENASTDNTDPTFLYYTSLTKEFDFSPIDELEFDPNCSYCHGTGTYTMDIHEQQVEITPCDKCSNQNTDISYEGLTREVTIYQFYAGFYHKDNSTELLPILPYQLNSDYFIKINKMEDIKKYSEDTNIDNYIFIRPILQIITDASNNKSAKLTSLEFYNINYKNTANEYIPLSVVKYVPGADESDDPLYADLTGFDEITKKQIPITDGNCDSYIKTIANYTIHCVRKTFTDIFDFNGIFNYLCYKDRNLTILPLNDGINVANSTSYIDYSFSQPEKNWFKFNNLLNNNCATSYSSLDGSNFTFYHFISKTTQGLSPFSYYPLILNILSDINKNNNLTITNTTQLNHNDYHNMSMKLKWSIELEKNPECGYIISDSGDYPLKDTVLISFSQANDSYTYPTTNGYVLTPEQDIFKLQEWVEQKQDDGTIEAVCIEHYEFATKFTHEETFDINFDLIPSALSYTINGIMNIVDAENHTYFTSGTLNVEMILLCNYDSSEITSKDFDSIMRLPNIYHNYNFVDEGVFEYYSSDYNTYIDNYVTYKYKPIENSNSQSLLVLNDIDTIENFPDKSYKNMFFNTLSVDKLKSIYIKEDLRTKMEECPECHGNKKITCKKCNNTGKVSNYSLQDASNKRITSNCPGLLAYHMAMRPYDMRYRCRICAGTGQKIEYLFYNCYEFKDISEYNGANPVESDLDTPPTVDDIKALTVKTITVDGVKRTLPYLNYWLEKKYDYHALDELDEKYNDYYNSIMSNIVFYKLNGDLTKYYYYDEHDYIQVDYGYKYIYSTKTYTTEDWEKVKDTAETRSNTVLYRILPTYEDFDNYIAFYVYSPAWDGPDVTREVFRRIYFHPSFIYEELAKSLKFKEFNYFVEEKHPYEIGEHIHNENDKLVEERCPTCYCESCKGTGYIEDEKCPVCNGTGITNPECPDCNGTGIKEDLPEIKLDEHYLYKYVALHPITTSNINYETYNRQKIKCATCAGSGCPKCNKGYVDEKD